MGKRANRMCQSCPFRSVDEGYKRTTAHLHNDEWPCHTEDLHGTAGINCRGHYEAIRKYGHLIGPQFDPYWDKFETSI